MSRLEPSTPTDGRWQQVLDRDPRADGAFVFAVLTTGIYCRPSCPARRPLPRNVRFFAGVAEAEAAGFRACLRCHPKSPSSAEAGRALIAEACRILATSDVPPKLEALASQIGLSPFHLHRQFKAVTGVTPRIWAAAARADRLRDALQAGGQARSVTAAIYDAGFNSPGRLYAQSDAVLGMTPTAYRKGGAGESIRYALTECTFGLLLVAQSDKGICAITMGDAAPALIEDLRLRFSNATLHEAPPDFAATLAEVVAFVEAPRRGLDLPLDIRGTAFQARVWQALQQIPAGKTASYGELAAMIKAPKAVRAVAQACGANKLAVAIPCHRILGHDGKLSGYRWGVARKAALLAREAEE